MDASESSRNLDLLRAVAVLCVLADHLTGAILVIQHRYVDIAQKMEAFGRLGVLFFFVHTALVLMRSLDRAKDKDLDLVVKFWIRRACRIYPLVWALLVGIVIFKMPQFVGLAPVTWSWQTIAANTLLMQNLTHGPDMMVQLWSLPREAQMYVILPFIFLLLRRFPSTITVLVLWLISIELSTVLPFFNYFPCFLGGVLAYQLSRERTSQLPGTTFVGGLAILMVGYTAFNWSPASQFYNFDFLLCMAVGVLIPNVKDINESFVTKVSQQIAKHSYGIYLGHIPIIWFSFVCLKHLPMVRQSSICAALLVVMPWISYKLIEAPMVRVGQRLAILNGPAPENPAPASWSRESAQAITF
jgi:peptidoglycan/LPS O-acetylase OafA/YrhL